MKERKRLTGAVEEAQQVEEGEEGDENPVDLANQFLALQSVIAALVLEAAVLGLDDLAFLGGVDASGRGLARDLDLLGSTHLDW